ncbi:MAG: DHH family phosphoesterase [Clostridia bacterium]|nr:DHH family phosphoesterase [Clostridia bacterium]
MAVLILALVGFTVASYFENHIIFYVEAGVMVAVLVFVVWRLGRMQYDIRRYLVRTAGVLNQGDQDSLAGFPLPTAVCSLDGEVLWYNDEFLRQVLACRDAFGAPAAQILPEVDLNTLAEQPFVDIALDGRQYTVYVSPLRVRDTKLFVLYYFDNTQLKEIAQEYGLSRPSVMMLYIDNVDEVLQTARESERAQILGQVENLLEDWVGETTGILRKFGTDRFLVILEQRHLTQIIQNRFDIQDRVRAVHTNLQGASVTLSIGVGSGETMKESAQLANQALEMALGRGGDQAAIKTRNGYDFYGGVSKGIEKHTKVRTRVIASALAETIRSSSNVLVMGHRFSDLDCLGSAAALAVLAREADKPAFVVTQRSRTLAGALIDRYTAAGQGDLFIEPADAMTMLQEKTLLIITDTHSPSMLEWPELYQKAPIVVVVDHHRRMVDCVENAVIFYHEPNASSACELVAELIQYTAHNHITRLEAEALLAGITLDTRNFVMKTGVRTFEAAAYLRKLGADTVEVKRMFAENMHTYRRRADLVAHAEIYKNVAIACDMEGGDDVRIAAAQAADELLTIKGVEASFVLFGNEQNINISARSYGDYNVQLVMEALGGGGHLTMAGALLQDCSIEQAKEKLLQAVNASQTERERARAVQQKANGYSADERKGV